jgi:hypothetical protein
MNNVANHVAKPRLRCEPLAIGHLNELASVLLHPQVYAYLGESPPSVEVFKLGLSRALQGPGPSAVGQMWLNYLVRAADSGDMLGRLEATVHDGLAEVAFLFAPATLWPRACNRSLALASRRNSQSQWRDGILGNNGCAKHPLSGAPESLRVCCSPIACLRSPEL